MSEIEFSEESGLNSPNEFRQSRVAGSKGIIGFLLRNHIVETQKQANTVLLIITVLFFAVAVSVFLFFTPGFGVSQMFARHAVPYHGEQGFPSAYSTSTPNKL